MAGSTQPPTKQAVAPEVRAEPPVSAAANNVANRAAAAKPDSCKQPTVACDHYRLDKAARQFGVCMCGFAKAAHAAAAFEQSPWQATVAARAATAEVKSCICGFAKAAHAAAAFE